MVKDSASSPSATLGAAGDDPGEFLAEVAGKIEGFFYRCVNNADWTMLRMTGGFDRVFGHAASTFIRERASFAALVHPADLPGLVGAIEEGIARDINWVANYRLLDARGKFVRVQESGGAVRHPQTGEILYLDGVVLDAQRLT